MALETEPLRLVVLCDLHASQEQASPFAITDAGDLQRLLLSLAPMIRVEVPNLLGTSPASLDVELRLSSLRDLTPGGLLDGVPALAAARRVVKLISGAGQAATPELTAALSEPGLERLLPLLDPSAALPRPATAPPSAAPPSAPPAGGPDVDRILQLVDLPSAQERAASAIGKVVGAIGRQRSTPAAERRTVAQALLAAIGQQIDAILHHPEVQALEAAWRGLRLLLNRTELRRGLCLHVLHAPRAALLDEALLDRIQSGLEGAGADLLLAATNLCDPVADAAVAERLGEVAAELCSPALFSVGLPFFGPLTEKGELPLSTCNLEPPAYLRWRALRERESSRWLAAICNRFLLRPPYTAEEAGGLAGYTESVARGEYLWGDPIWLVGVLAFRSFARLSWPTEILGSPAGRIDDLPVRPVQRKGRLPRRLPVEQPIEMDDIGGLARGGFLYLYASEDTDSALLLAAPTLYHQPAPGPRRGPAVGLPYQIAAGRIVRLVEGWRVTLVGRTVDEQVRALESSLRELVAGTGPGAAVKIDAVPPSSADARPEVNLDIRVGAAVLGGVSLELRFALEA